MAHPLPSDSRDAAPFGPARAESHPLPGQAQGLAARLPWCWPCRRSSLVLHPFIPALVWAVILAIALGPLYARAERRWPPGGHNIALPVLFTGGGGRPGVPSCPS